MDEQEQQAFDKIQSKDVSELTENDKAVLRARSSYLGRRARDRFKSVLEAKPEVTKEEKPAKSALDIDPFTDGADEA